MTPTAFFLSQLEKARGCLDFSERKINADAGASETITARARSGATPMNWNHVAEIAKLLERRYGVRRDWLLWGDGEMLEPRGEVLRLGPKSGGDPKPVRTRKRRGKRPSAPDPTPAAGDNGSGNKRPASS